MKHLNRYVVTKASPVPVIGVNPIKMVGAEDGHAVNQVTGGGKGEGETKTTTTQQQQQQTGQQQQQAQQQQTTKQQPAANQDDGKDSESEEDDGTTEILEESPDRRWSKRREQVKQRDVPGIDVAYLAMDNETGNEVVWNEVQFSERKNFRAQEEKINAVFDSLTQLVHTNLVKFHKYWTDAKSDKPRIIFITEYMSSGSMSQFLQRTKKAGTSVSMKSWKKWTAQILSALNYLHTYKPPITHGNLTCNTVFIQQNGLIKIGCGIILKDGGDEGILVAPDAIHHHVKTCKETFRYLHYIAPEYEQNNMVTPAADIYAFGVCALEMAMTGALVNPSSSSSSSASNGGTTPGAPTTTTTTSTTSEGPVPEEVIEKAVRSLEDPLQRDFIEQCLRKNPLERPTAQQLLYHPVFFDICTLKLIAAHEVIDSQEDSDKSITKLPELNMDDVVCAIGEHQFARRVATNFISDINKFLDEVREGIYPIGASNRRRRNPSSHSVSSTTNESAQSENAGQRRNEEETGSQSDKSRNRRDSTPLTSGIDHPSSSNANTPNSVSGKVQNGGGRQKSGDSSAHPTTSGTGPHSRASPSGDALNTSNASQSSQSAHSTPINASQQQSQSTQGSAQAGTRLTRGQSVTEADGYARDTGTAQRQRGDGGAARSESAERQEQKDDSHKENRTIKQMRITKEGRELKLWVQLEDLMNRQLTTELADEDTSQTLTDNLVYHGFICEEDRHIVEQELSLVLTDSVAAVSVVTMSSEDPESTSTSSAATATQQPQSPTSTQLQQPQNNSGAGTTQRQSGPGQGGQEQQTVIRKQSTEGKIREITVTPVQEKDKDKPAANAHHPNNSQRRIVQS
ncbi:hypothetical protein WR25_07311 [Diploscapter pachys]|uniref:Protein kinase domain-containing protein n=1 Tax=Diploscapter pachys TaxID=2018661 RepID=A0A2A2LJ11_9BILA|nr:hypothetical protein WR25_07311 [Diploscapter pachys]